MGVREKQIVKEESDKAIYLPREWYNGVVLEEAREKKATAKFKVTKSGVVIGALEQAGIKGLTDRELARELEKVAEGVPAE